jgi:hypothetical protein
MFLRKSRVMKLLSKENREVCNRESNDDMPDGDG